MSENRFFRLASSEEQSSEAEWYYSTREGKFGPFETHEAATHHFEEHESVSELAQSGLLNRLKDRLFGREPASDDDAELAETNAFERPARELGAMGSDQYQRLPNNRTVVIELEAGEEMELLLASYRFVLKIADRSLNLIDVDGNAHMMFQGTSTVGRRSNNDVVTDRNLGDISRDHLIIDWDGSSAIRLTDVSSLGSFVPPAKLSGE